MHGRGQRCLNAFFTHLLRNTLGSAGVQLRGIRTLRIRRFTLRQQLLQLVQEQPLVTRLSKAAAGALMAGRTDGVCQYQQGVVIAVRRNADHVQEVTRGFPFGPQALFRAGVKRHFAAVDRFRQRVLVHIPQHQHFA